MNGAEAAVCLHRDSDGFLSVIAAKMEATLTKGRANGPKHKIMIASIPNSQHLGSVAAILYLDEEGYLGSNPQITATTRPLREITPVLNEKGEIKGVLKRKKDLSSPDHSYSTLYLTNLVKHLVSPGEKAAGNSEKEGEKDGEEDEEEEEEKEEEEEEEEEEKRRRISSRLKARTDAKAALKAPAPAKTFIVAPKIHPKVAPVPAPKVHPVKVPPKALQASPKMPKTPPKALASTDSPSLGRKGAAKRKRDDLPKVLLFDPMDVDREETENRKKAGKRRRGGGGVGGGVGGEEVEDEEKEVEDEEEEEEEDDDDDDDEDEEEEEGGEEEEEVEDEDEEEVEEGPPLKKRKIRELAELEAKLAQLRRELYSGSKTPKKKERLNSQRKTEKWKPQGKKEKPYPQRAMTQLHQDRERAMAEQQQRGSFGGIVQNFNFYTTTSSAEKWCPCGKGTFWGATSCAQCGQKFPRDHRI